MKMESWKNKSTINTIRPRGSDIAKSRSSEHLKKLFQEKKNACTHSNRSNTVSRQSMTVYTSSKKNQAEYPYNWL